MREIERLILCGGNAEVNGYLKKAAAGFRYALADLKSAAFEAITCAEVEKEYFRMKNMGRNDTV